MPSGDNFRAGRDRSALGHKGPLTPEAYAELLAMLQRRLDAREARKKRYTGLRRYGKPRRGRVMFDHLPQPIRADAERRFAIYKDRNKVKLESLTGLARVRYLGSLAGAATRHALGRNVAMAQDGGRHGRNMKRHIHGLQCRLGLRERTPSVKAPGGWVSREDRMAQIARVHETHDAPAKAEASRANMEGV